jgi:pyridoxal 5'-phosphate synthase pdxT subunit
MTKLKIGILGIQGDVEENSDAVKESLMELETEGLVIQLKKIAAIEDLDGMVIPGGESTVMGTLLSLQKMQMELLRNKINKGLPVLGTCAGLILLANKAHDKIIGETNQPLLRLLDVTIERNAFGRQRESFETDLEIPILGTEPFRGVFIRGPVISEMGKNVQILTKFEDKVVAVRQDNIIATSFHPELANDNRLHKSFLSICLEYKRSKEIDNNDPKV